MSENVHFSARQLKFIEWLATTKYDRHPPTQALLAQELGLNPKTLCRWKKNKDLREAVIKRARELLGDDLPEIYGALRREATQGSFQHIKLALEMTGEYMPTEHHEHIIEFDMDDWKRKRQQQLGDIEEMEEPECGTPDA